MYKGKPPVRYTGKRQAEFARRWEEVCREIGPPPIIGPAVVPCVGYVTERGVRYPARWRVVPGPAYDKWLDKKRGRTP